MPRAYSADLRERVLAAYESDEGSQFAYRVGERTLSSLAPGCGFWWSPWQPDPAYGGALSSASSTGTNPDPQLVSTYDALRCNCCHQTNSWLGCSP